MKGKLDKLFLLLLALALAAGCGGTLLLHKLKPQTTSFYENRALAAAPDFSRASLWSGESFTQLDTFLSDHFLARTRLIRADTKLALAVGRPEVNGVALGDGAIFPFHGYYSWDLGYLKAQAEERAADLGRLRAQIESYGGRLYYVGVPQQYSYYKDKYPSYMDDRQWVLTETRSQFKTALAAEGIDFIDGQEVYDTLGRPDSFYSPSDHHYSYAGMLAVYRALLEEVNRTAGLDLAILDEASLNLRALPNPFLGSQNRKLFGCWPTDERLTVGELAEDVPFERWDNGLEAPPTVFDLPETDSEEVSFSVYMGGDVAETVIVTHREDLPKCLLWGDSFTNPMETVLWASFDEFRSLDLRHYSAMSLSEYIDRYRPDVVVCLRDDSAFMDGTGNGTLF